MSEPANDNSMDSIVTIWSRPPEERISVADKLAWPLRAKVYLLRPGQYALVPMVEDDCRGTIIEDVKQGIYYTPADLSQKTLISQEPFSGEPLNFKDQDLLVRMFAKRQGPAIEQLERSLLRGRRKDLTIRLIV